MKHLFVFLILNIDWSIQRKSNDCLTASTGGEGDTSKPFYIDPTFIKINWTDLNDGWDEAARLDYLDLVRKLKYQRKIMPKFTKLGYIKMEIPQRVLDVILKEKFKHSVPEGCDPIIGTSWSINCRKIDDEGRIMSKNNIHLFHFGSDLIVKKGEACYSGCGKNTKTCHETNPPISWHFPMKNDFLKITGGKNKKGRLPGRIPIRTIWEMQLDLPIKTSMAYFQLLGQFLALDIFEILGHFSIFFHPLPDF